MSTDTVDTYLQFDGSRRIEHFSQFVASLKTLVARGEVARASDLAARAVSAELDYSSLRTLGRFIPPVAAGGNPAAVRIAVLGGPATQQLVELLRIFLAGENIRARIYEAEYGLFRQEILSPSQELTEFSPQIVIIATSARDLTHSPDLAMSREDVEQLAQRECAQWTQLWDIASRRWDATIIQNTFEVPPYGALGHFGMRFHASPETFVNRVNGAMAELAPSNVVLHDLQSLIVGAGAREWFDPRFYLEAKMPCGAECLASYAHSLMSLIRAVRGKSKKVLVLDLDNTLWGGVVGDLGPGGIIFGQGSGEGEAYLAFQAFCKSLNDRGILLAVCSKNDEEKARQPFLQRTDMVLKLDHFACFVANWADKAENLRTIANSLNLAIDSLVFVDDNPAERALVRKFLPTVAVPDIPADPAGYIQALFKHRYFETVSMTREDSLRQRYYAQNAQRKALESSSTNLDEFLASLEMTGRVEPVSALNIERTTQLINKSNQFNLTTKRRTVAEVEEIAASPDWIALSISLRDKLGDHGLISVVFLRRRQNCLEIDTWVMSCRVLQRGVERMVLDAIIGHAKAASASKLIGQYIATERNGLVKDHYRNLGFAMAGGENGKTQWEFTVPDEVTPSTIHIRLEV